MGWEMQGTGKFQEQKAIENTLIRWAIEESRIRTEEKTHPVPLSEEQQQRPQDLSKHTLHSQRTADRKTCHTS